MSHETLLLFKELLDQVSLPANHPDFDAKAALISKARRELTAAIEASGADGE